MRNLLAVLIILSLCAAAHAFGTVNFVGQGAEHERITQIGLRSFGFGPQTLLKLAGNKSKFGAVGGPDRPDRGLIDNPEYHCDGGDYLDVPGYAQTQKQARSALEACRKIIFRFIEKAIRSAGKIVSRDGSVDRSEVPTRSPCAINGLPGRAKCEVLDYFGVALHAAQDFYSHSNWTDIAADGPIGPLNPPGLGQSGPASFINPAVRGAFPKGLISGCFVNIPEERYCFYSERKDRVRHKALSKDVGVINLETGAIGKGRTERGLVNDNFKRAVRAAIQDTGNKWRYFEAQVLAKYGQANGKVIICAVKNDDELACNH